MTLLTKRYVEKPWGQEVLPPAFAAKTGSRVGEVWFEPPSELSTVLVKYIFTSESLSVQVHPDDAQACEIGEADRGKEECWLVIAADADAKLGIGFKEHVDAEMMRRGALDGSIEGMLAWYPVRPGDFFYIPAGTVHAIGAGVSLIEIQQNSDVTYRLYDYGRPRELHLDLGLAVARGEPHDPKLRMHLPETGTIELARGPHFFAHRVAGIPEPEVLAQYQGNALVIPLRGSVLSEGGLVGPGDCEMTVSVSDLTFDPSGLAVLVRPGGAAS